MLKYTEGGKNMFTTILIISIIIVLVVLFLAVGTTSKAYTYKHTIDPIDPLPNGEEVEKKDSKE
jgi:flagellar basal body-associated protein FliL